MEIKITGAPKEIAGLVVAIQSQPTIKTDIQLDEKIISKGISCPINVGGLRLQNVAHSTMITKGLNCWQLDYFNAFCR